MQRRDLLASAGFVGALCLAGRVRAKAGERKPNILFILADDLGYADLSCYGAREYETPVLDKLAEDGVVRFAARGWDAAVEPVR